MPQRPVMLPTPTQDGVLILSINEIFELFCDSSCEWIKKNESVPFATLGFYVDDQLTECQ